MLHSTNKSHVALRLICVLCGKKSVVYMPFCVPSSSSLVVCPVTFARKFRKNVQPERSRREFKKNSYGKIVNFSSFKPNVWLQII